MKIIVLISCISLSASLYGQGSYAGLGFGLGKSVPSSSTNLDVFPGGCGSFDIRYRRQGIRLEWLTALSLSSSGFSAKQSSQRRVDYNFTCLSLPIRIGFYQGSKVQVFAKAGLTPSYLRQEQTDHFSNSLVLDKYSRFNIEVVGEIGGRIELADLWCSVAFNFMEGLNSIERDQNSPVPEGTRQRQFIVQLSLTTDISKTPNQ